MKKLGSALLLFSLLVSGPVGAADERDDWISTCIGWNQLPRTYKNSFIHGYLTALEIADAFGTGDIFVKLWPQGHRVGSVTIELDVACEKPENRNKAIGPLLAGIGIYLNRNQR